MAEAIAAFALAGNVLQFLEVGGKLVKQCWDIYNSNGNALQHLEEVEALTLDLQNTLKSLESPASTGQDTRLASLSKECFVLAQQLLDTIEETGLRRQGSRRGILVTVFKATWKSSKIAEQQGRIDMYRRQLATLIMASLRLVVLY
jgi:hypothetical protein